MVAISISLVVVRILGEILQAKHQAKGRPLVNFGFLSSPVFTLGQRVKLRRNAFWTVAMGSELQA